MKTPELVPLFTMDLELGVTTVAQTSQGLRVTTPVRSGRFEGDRLSGTVLDMGGDWTVVDSQNVFRVDVAIILQIDDGPAVHMFYKGRLAMPEDGMERMGRGETIDPASLYFRISPLFEVERGPYEWLNTIQAIGTGAPGPGTVSYEVYEVS